MKKFGSDSIQCVTNISLFREYVKQKNYDDALVPWRAAYISCPKSTKNIYIDGAKLYKYLISKNKGNIDVQKSYLDSLENLYDNRVNYFGDENYVLGLKGSDMIRYSFSDNDRAFSYLKQSVEALELVLKQLLFFHTLKSATEKYKSNSFDKSQVLEVYALVSDYLDINISNESKSQKFYIKAAENVEKLFVPFATCDDLINMFILSIKKLQMIYHLLNRIVKVLNKKNCSDAEVFYLASKNYMI